MRWGTRLGAAAAGAVGVAILAGCGDSGRGVSIPLGSESLPPCDPPWVIGAADLAAVGAPGCDLVGSSIVFPNGTLVDVMSVGEVFWSSEDVVDGREHTVVNWGVPGVGAMVVEDGRLVEVWGTTDEAESLQREQARIEGHRVEDD